MPTNKIRKYILPNIPYLFTGWACLKLGTAYRLAAGAGFGEKLLVQGQGQDSGAAGADGSQRCAKKKIKTYSGGMKQRLGIAQTLPNDPKLLALDELTAGLEPKERIRYCFSGADGHE